MSDLDNLSKQRQAILQIKIDGHIEAAMLASKANCIGLSEALALASRALVREMAAKNMDRDMAHSILMVALHSGFPERKRRPPLYRN